MPLSPSATRIVSLDQFRGYSVAGMFLVNFLGGYATVPQILLHSHDYCSYADTIMPHFLFAVGFAFRLTFERRVQRDGSRTAYGRVVQRLLGLILVSMVIYTPRGIPDTWEQLREGGLAVLAEPLKRNWFQTLMHIAVTSLWVLPVIRARAGVRIGFAVASAIAHIALSYWFNFTWVNTAPNGIDGGPLGFLTWTIPAIAGTLACDIVTMDGTPRVRRLITWAIVLMAFGWVISCGTRFYDVPTDQVESRRSQKMGDDPVVPGAQTRQNRPDGLLLAEPPFVPPPDSAHRKWNYWMMSQRGGTVSYLTFSAGFSLLVYSLFHVACDRWGWRLGIFETFGTNALVAYILHGLVGDAVSPFIPHDAPGWYVTVGFGIFFGITWLMVRTLEKNRVYLKL